LAEAKTDKEVVIALSITVKTVDACRANVMHDQIIATGSSRCLLGVKFSRAISRSEIGNVLISPFRGATLESGVLKQTSTTLTAPDSFSHPLGTLVVNNSVLLLKVLYAYLRAQLLFQVVSIAMSGREALHMVELLGPDLVLIDLRMPVMNGWQAKPILRRRVPNVRIVMTMGVATTAEAEAQTRGAHGFVGKWWITNDLITDVRRVFRPNHTKNGPPCGIHI
jgi:CheY-like chemotaxis protein